MTTQQSTGFGVTSVLGPVEFAVNRLLSTDEKARTEILALDGKIILIGIDGLNIELFASFVFGRVMLSHEYPRGDLGNPANPSKVDVQLRGKIKDFVALIKNQRDGESVSAGQVEIQGDLATAQRVQNLLRNLNVDIEEIVAQATSDAFAYRLGRVARSSFGLIKNGLKGLEEDIGNYMLYEKRVTPSQQELSDFAGRVDDVTLGVERLGSRIEKLLRTRASASNSGVNNSGEREVSD
jgi:ubiquinone biosynthesis accessory factor UbiJ